MKSDIVINYVHLETELVISSETTQLLIIENPSEFYSLVSMLYKQIEGEEGDFIFLANNQPINCSKSAFMIVDLFNFDLNDKKIVNLLYKKLEGVAINEKYAKLSELNSVVVSFLEDLTFSVPFSLDYGEIQPIDFFKSASLKFEKTYDTLLEKIICYVNALIELKGCEFFVFVNLKGVLSDTELSMLYKHCSLEQVGLLLIENSKCRQLLPNEKAVIITEDLCEIVENY